MRLTGRVPVHQHLSGEVWAPGSMGRNQPYGRWRHEEEVEDPCVDLAAGVEYCRHPSSLVCLSKTWV
jgi:hypothetical protein